MKGINLIILVVLLLIPIAEGHSIDTKEIIRSDGIYNIKFSVNPQFPLANRETHLDFEVWDNKGMAIEDQQISIVLAKGEEREVLRLTKTNNHYDVEYHFNEPGIYKITPIIGERELNTNFEIEVDSFGTSGIVRSSVIVLFLLIIIILMYKDCKVSKRRSLK